MWAPELKRLLLSVAIRVHRGQPPLRLRSTVPRMNALTAAERKDMEMWQNHINQEHLPMRRDCHDCLLAMGRDRPRRRQVCPASYCLSIDVAGPFEPAGNCLGQGRHLPAQRWPRARTLHFQFCKTQPGDHLPYKPHCLPTYRITNPRYFLIGCYTLPVSQGVALTKRLASWVVR